MGFEKQIVHVHNVPELMLLIHPLTNVQQSLTNYSFFFNCFVDVYKMI